ncbi:hypothetical protein [Methanolobus bombayensis]|uniref:hypothetical protein n=1 Tax=Methanolobus bombayensis TaxID=38023 RepID=UPI001AE96ADB|nr:hypothetical protein [Methanolobus bombayensis]MBP1910376.1 hypothetical protein [Methanolobus bombayensis]
MNITKKGMRIITIFAVMMMLFSIIPMGAMAASENANEHADKTLKTNNANVKATDDDTTDDDDSVDSKNNGKDKVKDRDRVNATVDATRAENANMNSANAAGKYQVAKSNFANVKSQNPKLDTEEAINATKEYLNSSIDYMLTFLDEEEDEDYIDQLEEERDNLEEASTRKELAESAKNIRSIWNDIRKDRVVSKGKVIDNKINSVIKTSKALSLRLENEISRMEANGQDVTDLEEMLTSYNELIASAEKKQEQARNAYMNGEGTDAENIREANQYFTEAGEEIREANALLRNMFGMIKQQREGLITLSGEGTLEANGTGTVVISGNVTINVTAEDVNIIVKDLADDATIDTEAAEFNESNIDSGNSTDNNRAFVFIGLSGDVHLEGSRLTVMIKGTGINLVAEGTGSVVLAGQGTYGAEGTTGEWANRVSDDEDEDSEYPEDELEAETEDEQEDADDDSVEEESDNSDETESEEDEQNNEEDNADQNETEN